MTNPTILCEGEERGHHATGCCRKPAKYRCEKDDRPYGAVIAFFCQKCFDEWSTAFAYDITKLGWKVTPVGVETSR